MQHAVVLDAKLLTLFIVGATSAEYISRHKRLRPYTRTDFELLISLLRPASGVLLTPNTLSEVSNWLGYIDDPARTLIFGRFRELIQSTEERYIESKRAVARNEFNRLGLADAALLDLAADSHTLLTDDFDLYRAALDQDFPVINFTHIRASHLET